MPFMLLSPRKPQLNYSQLTSKRGGKSNLFVFGLATMLLSFAGIVNVFVSMCLHPLPVRTAAATPSSNKTLLSVGEVLCIFSALKLERRLRN